MNLDAIAELYPDFDLYALEKLNLCHAQCERQEHLINHEGRIIYSLPANTDTDSYFTNFTWRNNEKLLEALDQQINVWWQGKIHTEVKKPRKEGSPTAISYTLFTVNHGAPEQLLPNEQILGVEAIGPSKLLLQVAVNNSGPITETDLSIFDTNSRQQKIIARIPFESSPLQPAFYVHAVLGLQFLFSVKIKTVPAAEGDYQHPIYRLFNNCGDPLLPFDTTIGQNGETTWFEPNKQGLGICYRLLPEVIHINISFYHPQYAVCNVLINQQGRVYGEFYHVAGQIPSAVGKSSTRHPKWINKKLLCLSLPDNNNPYPCLVFVDQQGNRIETPYECPWIFAFVSRALITDKTIFGGTCITVLDKERMVRLIDFEGKEIPGTQPIPFSSLMINYTKLFIEQKAGQLES
ncbi:MAG TPA: hypothetical protein PLQ65_00235 [Flavihumibacter sp.]|nr:hypothetical protein [Bacteroidota bacterium]HQD08058.1 hypothetical protein [Flavihumibacter sp.]